MTRIVAAVDQSAAATPVIRASLALGRLFDARPEVVHVREGGTGSTEMAAAAAGLELQILDGDPKAALVSAIGQPDVAAGVLGTRRRPTGPRPAGSTALWVVERVHKPVAVVPPEWIPAPSFERAIVPLDAAEATSAAVKEAVSTCAFGGLEIVVVHVFCEGTVPRFWDRPVYEEDDWAQEFLSRHVPDAAANIELRTGSPAPEVLGMTRGPGDLVLLAWAQNLSGGHAELVRELLSNSPVPVMLIPLGRAGKMAA